MSTVPRQIGRYELQQQLGRGSAGEVWKGHNPLVHQDVAIKLLYPDLQSDPNFMTRCAQLGQALTTLHYPNLVHVREIDIARPDGGNETTAYLVMDYIEGQTLTDYINATARKGAFPSPEQIVYLFTSLGLAIDYSHQRGFIHGNIKPGNILLSRHNKKHFEGGEPQLSDLGIAQLLGSTGSASSTNSPLYMSPEQARGYPISSKSDIYSLGVILYEICTGVPPFREESSVAVMMQHINALPTPPSLINANIPFRLSEVILRAMSKNPDARYSKASLLASAIADACALQSTVQFSSERPFIDNDEEVYTQSESTGSILGVSQPSQKLPSHMPISQPLPRVSGPLMGISGKHPIVRTNPNMPVPPLHITRLTPSAKFPAVPAETLADTHLPISTQTHKIVVSAPLSLTTQRTPATSPASQELPPPRAPQKRKRSIDTPIYLACAVLLLVLLVLGSAMGANLLLKSKQQPTTSPPVVMTGHVFFLDDALGHNDQLRIEMQNVPAPAKGKSYVAWFQDQNDQMQLLGPLSVQNGSITYTYPGNPQHTNLLTTIQNLSITLENSGRTPQTPSTQIAYQAQFDTTLLPSLKNILYSTPGLPKNQSVVAALLDTIKSMNDKAGSINDTLQGQLDQGLVRRQATRIIETIDGTNYAFSSGDLPTKYHSLSHTTIGLLSSPQQKGYLDILAAQIDSFKQAAQGHQEQLTHAQNVENALIDLRNWIQKIRTYDITILKAPVLTQPTIISTALQLKNITADAYTGLTIPPDPAPKPVVGSAGAYQAYTEAQYMAALDFTPA
jgi:eukaryotic-like serine/threonine-protein kinase